MKNRSTVKRTAERPYRVWFHWRKCDDRMTVHFRNRCINVYDFECNVQTEPHRNKRQPRLVMKGFCKDVRVKNDRAYIS